MPSSVMLHVQLKKVEKGIGQDVAIYKDEDNSPNTQNDKMLWI